MQHDRLLPHRSPIVRLQRRLGSVPHGLPTAATLSGAVGALIVGTVVGTSAVVPMLARTRPWPAGGVPGAAQVTRVAEAPLIPASAGDASIALRTEKAAMVATVATSVIAPGSDDAPVHAGARNAAGPAIGADRTREDPGGVTDSAPRSRDDDAAPPRVEEDGYATTAGDDRPDDDDRPDEDSWRHVADGEVDATPSPTPSTDATEPPDDATP